MNIYLYIYIYISCEHLTSYEILVNIFSILLLVHNYIFALKCTYNVYLYVTLFIKSDCVVAALQDFLKWNN